MTANILSPRRSSQSMRALSIAGLLASVAAVASPAHDRSDVGRPLSWSEWASLAEDASSAELVVWLEDDEISWNASAAGRELLERVRDGERADDAVAALWAALESNDLQASQVAAGLLQ